MLVKEVEETCKERRKRKEDMYWRGEVRGGRGEDGRWRGENVQWREIMKREGGEMICVVERRDDREREGREERGDTTLYNLQ